MTDTKLKLAKLVTSLSESQERCDQLLTSIPRDQSPESLMIVMMYPDGSQWRVYHSGDPHRLIGAVECLKKVLVEEVEEYYE